MLDSHPVDGSNPETNHEAVELELTQHNPRLAELPRILALSKGDLVDEETRERLRRHWRKRIGPQTPIVVTSAATGLGLPQLTGELSEARAWNGRSAGAGRRPPPRTATRS